MGNDIAHTQYDYFANIAVEQAKQHGVEISHADSPIWMASKEDVEYLLKNCGRDIMSEQNIENTYRFYGFSDDNFNKYVKNIKKRNNHTYLRLYNPNDVCLYIASREKTSYINDTDFFYDPLTGTTSVSQKTLRFCDQVVGDEELDQRPARYACLWTSTLAPEGDDNTKAWALQITPDGCCLVKMDRSTKLPALMVGRPIDPNVISTRKNINLKY